MATSEGGRGETNHTDEPTGNLDTRAGDRVLELMRAANAATGAAFLIVTHDDSIARRCDRIVHLVDGRVESDSAEAGKSAAGPG
jgi:lipoprotein-releasing system ATP-binding protein